MFEVGMFDPKTLSWWHDERDNIDFKPPYQRRGGIWNPSDKQYLIDSILNGFDVPKIYLADFSYGHSTLNHAKKQFAIIDGKQRLSAIFEFFDGKLVLAKDFVWFREPTLPLGGLSYKDLLSNFPKAASKFANASLTFMRVVTDEEAKINELFIRLNRGKALSGAELRNAMRGLVPDLIRKIGEHKFFQSHISFKTQRLEHNNVAAKLLLVEFRQALVDTKKTHLDRFVEEGAIAEASEEQFQEAQKRVNGVLDNMCSVFSKKDDLLKSQGPVTLYYWLVRESAKRDIPKLRRFLVGFQEARIANRKLSKNSAKKADSELLKYDILDRSTNDQNSLSGRYEILRKRFNGL